MRPVHLAGVCEFSLLPSGIRRPTLSRRTNSDSSRRPADEPKDRDRASKLEKKEDKDRDDRPRKSGGLNKALGATDDIDALLALLASQDPKRGAMAMEGFERVFNKDKEAIYGKAQQILSSMLSRVELLIRNPPADAKDKQRAQRNMDAIVRFVFAVTHLKGEPRADKLLSQEICSQNNLTILSTYELGVLTRV